MVAGYDGSSQLSSTEILVSGSNSWVTISPLPISVYALRTVNYKNTILAFGNLSFTFIKVIVFLSLIMSATPSLTPFLLLLHSFPIYKNTKTKTKFLLLLAFRPPNLKLLLQDM